MLKILLSIFVLIKLSSQGCNYLDVCLGSGITCCEANRYLYIVNCIGNLVMDDPISCGDGANPPGCNTDDSQCYADCEIGRLMKEDGCCDSYNYGTNTPSGPLNERRIESVEYCQYGCNANQDPDVCHQVECEIGSKCSSTGYYCCNQTIEAYCNGGEIVSIDYCSPDCVAGRCFLSTGCEDNALCTESDTTVCCNDLTTAYCNPSGNIEAGSQSICPNGCNNDTRSCYSNCEMDSECSINSVVCCENENEIDCDGDNIISDPRNCTYGCRAGCLEECDEGSLCPAGYDDGLYCCPLYDKRIIKCENNHLTLYPLMNCPYGCKHESSPYDRCFDQYEIESTCKSDKCNGDTLVNCINFVVENYTDCDFGCNVQGYKCYDECEIGATCDGLGFYCCDATTKASCDGDSITYIENCGIDCRSDTCFDPTGCENKDVCTNSASNECCNAGTLAFCDSDLKIQNDSQILCPYGCNSATNACYSECEEEASCGISGKICCASGTEESECQSFKVTNYTSVCNWGCENGCYDQCDIKAECEVGYDDGFYCCGDVEDHIYVCQNGKIFQIADCLYGCKNVPADYDICYSEYELNAKCSVEGNFCYDEEWYYYCDGSYVNVTEQCEFGCDQSGCFDKCERKSKCSNDMCCDFDLGVCVDSKIDSYSNCTYRCKVNPTDADTCFEECELGASCDLYEQSYCCGDNAVECASFGILTSVQECTLGCEDDECIVICNLVNAKSSEVCNGHGKCETNEICTCDDEWKGEWCSDQKISDTVIIVLSSVGSSVVFVVLVLIAIVFCCIFAKKKKKSYNLVEMEQKDEVAEPKEKEKEKKKEKENEKEKKKKKKNKI